MDADLLTYLLLRARLDLLPTGSMPCLDLAANLVKGQHTCTTAPSLWSMQVMHCSKPIAPHVCMIEQMRLKIH